MRRLFTIVACLVAALAFAHDGPDDRIHDLTHQIEDEGATPKLLTARAYEYRSLGAYEKAIADYAAALAASPNYAPALHGIAQTLLRAERLEEAEKAAHDIITRLSANHDKASAQAILARIDQRQKNYEEALMHWRAALAHGDEIDWFLGEATSLRAMNRYDDAVTSLDRARMRNASAAIHRAWLGALIDANRGQEALAEIDTKLETARWKSTWLVLRARAFVAIGDENSAQADAARALEEIAERLDPERPDGFLLADAAAAHAILGDESAARHRFEQARKLRVPESYLASLQ